MTTIRQFTCDDFFKFNFVELCDQPRALCYHNLEEYLEYISKYPDYYLVAESPSGDLMGYIMGTDTKGVEETRSCICLLVCSESYRSIGVATNLMNVFEWISKRKRCNYLELHVQISNSIAMKLYQK
jgi:N-terminal acetyltransferase B complex catalytic subunit